MNNTITNKKFLLLLPKISSKEYAGKYLCTVCLKEVKKNQQAVSCDNCERWAHRACNKISIKNYRNLKLTKNFPFTCYSCKNKEAISNSELFNKIEAKDIPELPANIKSQTNELLIINLNARSLLNKEEELFQLIKDTDADIICVSETWYDDSIPISTNVPKNYNIIRKDRSQKFKDKYSKKGGGGVAIIYKKHIKIEKKPKLCDDTEEILFVQVNTKPSFMLGVVYKPNYSDLLFSENETILEETISKATETTNRIIVTGDYNVDLFDQVEKESLILNSIMEGLCLQQQIKKPTRVNMTNFSKTLLDHFWTSPEIEPKNSGTITGISDHFGTYLKLNVKKQLPPLRKIKFRSYKNYIPQLYNMDLKVALKNSNIHELIKNKSVNESTELLTKIISDTAENHAPLKEKILKPRDETPPWYNKELKELINFKNCLLNDVIATGNASLLKSLKRKTNFIKREKRKLKRVYIHKQLEEIKNDISKLWALLRVITNRPKNKEIIEPEVDQKRADDYNKFFATVGIRVQNEIMKKHPKKTATFSKKEIKEKFIFKKETPKRIEKIIDGLNVKVAVGKDQISARLIKDAKDTLAPIISQIINVGYEKNIFPDSLKCAIIKPIFKDGNQNEITNYRPISILPILSKIFERAAANQIVHFLEENHLLSKNQHAYRKFLSTTTCLFELITKIHTNLDKKILTAIASLDLSKAFDSINHDFIIEKLQNLGMDLSVTQWINSYLKNRKQATKFSNFISKEESVESGVPQGSILGPLLFLCFTNDLPEYLEKYCTVFSYADDTQLLVEAKNSDELQQKIEAVVDAAQNWYNNNFMKNNTSKTEIIVFNPTKDPCNISLKTEENGKEKIITPKRKIKILGVFIDNDLTWTDHVNFVKKRTFNVTRQLHRVNFFLPLKNRLMLYNTLLAPLFNYADIIWGGCTKKAAKSLQLVQNFAVRSITGNKKRDSATASLKKVKLLNLETRRLIHETVFLHKALLGQNSKNVCELIQKYLPKSSTRHSTSKNLNNPTHNYAKFEKSPLYRCIKSWNSTPNNLPKDDVVKHKNMLQIHLINTKYNTN